jgi:hypothetical protein
MEWTARSIAWSSVMGRLRSLRESLEVENALLKRLLKPVNPR